VDLFTLSAKLQLDKDDYDKGLDDAESKAYKVGQGIGSFINTVGKVSIAGLTAAVGAVASLVKKSVSEYAEYQQLWGGVQKLYGTAGMSVEEYAQSVGKSVDEVKGKYDELTQAQDMVLKNAENAYATAGMSTQKYMEQATSFSAALINSLEGDTVKAAEQTDVAMRAISDNYNTFGGDMQMIQNAYTGFAKGNFMMLDNLKLGYGGTKTEMERLIADANEYANSMGMAADLSVDSFSDIVTAIDLVQQKQGIAGTTAREATETISGSLGMLKASWQNLVAGLADPDADVSKLIDNVVKSIVGYTDETGKHVKGFIDNIIPTIKQSVKGIVQVIRELVPVISKELPELIADILPMLIETGAELLDGLIDALPDLIQALIEQLPTLIDATIDAVVKLLPMIVELGLQFIMALANGIIEALPELIPAITEVILQIVTLLTQPDTIVQLVMAAVQIMMAIAQGLIEALPQLIEALPTIIMNLVEALIQLSPELLKAGWELIKMLAKGIIDAHVAAINAAVELMDKLKEKIIEKTLEYVEKGKEIVNKLIKGIKESYSNLKAKGKELVDKVKEGFKEKVEQAKTWGKDLIQNFINGLKEKWENLKSTVTDIAGSIKDVLGFSEPKVGPLSNFHTYAPDMMDLFAKGVRDNKHMLINTVEDAFNFQDLITSPVMPIQSGYAPYTGDTKDTNTNTNSNIDVYVTLEGDADRIFRVVKSEAKRNEELTGQPAFS
jgi:phage-related protein